MITALLTAVMLVAVTAPNQRLQEPDMQGEDPPEIRDEVPPPDCVNGSMVWDEQTKEYRRWRRGDPVCVP